MCTRTPKLWFPRDPFFQKPASTRIFSFSQMRKIMLIFNENSDSTGSVFMKLLLADLGI